jgi:hypothetical protein
MELWSYGVVAEHYIGIMDMSIVDVLWFNNIFPSLYAGWPCN